MRKSFLLLPSLFLLINSYADVGNTNITSITAQNTAINSTVVGNAQEWDLSSEEWNHYQQLMQGPDGHWYPNLTPPEVLGLNAKTSLEQQHFAIIVAKQAHDKLARELIFDRAVHQAALQLYANESIIQTFDTTSFNPIKSLQSKPSISLHSGDHLSVFIDSSKGLDFAVLPTLMTAVKSHPDVILDIFCVGNADDNTIRRWAKLNNIPMDLVSAGRITLNQDNGQLQKVMRANAIALPYVLLVRKGVSMPISVGSML